MGGLRGVVHGTVAVHLHDVRAKPPGLMMSFYCDTVCFTPRKETFDSRLLPPCQDTLRKHCQRANYQAAVWRRSLQNSPVLPSPIGNGWFMKRECLALDWMSGESAPKVVLELLFCQCNRLCQLPNCTCLANGLKCTALCKL